MSFKLTVNIFGLCAIMENDGGYHKAIGVSGADHQFFVVVPTVNLDANSTLTPYETKFFTRFFPLEPETIVEVKTASIAGLSNITSSHQPATIADLGLVKLKDGIGNGDFETGEMVRCLLPVVDTKTAWLDTVGKYTFTGNGIKTFEAADHFVWRGMYNSHVTIEVMKPSGLETLILKDIGADFSIGVGCVKMTETGDPFDEAEAFHLVSDGAQSDYKAPAVSLRARHVGSSSCPPVQGP